MSAFGRVRTGFVMFGPVEEREVRPGVKELVNAPELTQVIDPNDVVEFESEADAARYFARRVVEPIKDEKSAREMAANLGKAILKLPSIRTKPVTEAAMRPAPVTR
jgi:hypothetical protein